MHLGSETPTEVVVGTTIGDPEFDPVAGSVGVDFSLAAGLGTGWMRVGEGTMGDSSGMEGVSMGVSLMGVGSVGGVGTSEADAEPEAMAMGMGMMLDPAAREVGGGVTSEGETEEVTEGTAAVVLVEFPPPVTGPSTSSSGLGVGLGLDTPDPLPLGNGSFPSLVPPGYTGTPGRTNVNKSLPVYNEKSSAIFPPSAVYMSGNFPRYSEEGNEVPVEVRSISTVQG
jgi:hypothetical protein